MTEAGNTSGVATVTQDELSGVELLHSLPPDALAELAHEARVRRFEAGETILREGEPGHSMHIVRSGQIKVVRLQESGQELKLMLLEAGDYFGELAVLNSAPRAATVIAIEDSETIELDKDDLERVLNVDPLLPRLMMGALARSLTAAKEEVARHNEILEVKVQERTREVRETQLEVIRRLGMAAEFRDDDTGLHIMRMSRFCARLAREIGFGVAEVELILNASPMHDIGKIGIPDRVLLKPGKLDDEEWAIMKTHAEVGAALLSGSNSEVMKLAEEIALSHHEKWNGKGYPHGIKGEAIPLAARICTVSDVFDALISERPYKKPWTVEDAMKLIGEQAGEDFDPQLAKTFVGLESEIRQIIEEATREYQEAHA